MKNVHERVVNGSAADVWAVVETLATPDDRLWPHDVWPAMELDRGLVVGSRGGHADVRYNVESITPGRSVVLRFEPPTGLDGMHRFDLEPTGPATTLRHTIDATPTGSMRVVWPLMVRWIHDAVVEDAFDNVDAALRHEPVDRRRPNAYVRQLVRMLRPHRPDRIGTFAGAGAAATLGATGVLHGAWALGSTFPAADAQALARSVVGGDTFPSSAASATVAGLLGTATVIVAARTFPRTRLGRRLPGLLARPAVVIVSTVLAMRGVGGILVSALGMPSTTPAFRIRNLVMYSPLCIALAVALTRLERNPTRNRDRVAPTATAA